VEITKTVAQIKLSKENQLTKSAQCSAILALLQQRPDANKLSQTAPVAIGNQSGGTYVHNKPTCTDIDNIRYVPVWQAIWH